MLEVDDVISVVDGGGEDDDFISVVDVEGAEDDDIISAVVVVVGLPVLVVISGVLVI